MSHAYKTLTFYSLMRRCAIPCACHAKRHLNLQNMWCFVHIDFEMCFAPQQRALFRHLNFQKCSGAGVFCTFWLPHVLRATTACTFSTSQLPKVVRSWCVLYILIWPDGSAPAALASLLFDPPEPQIIGKKQCFATFLPFRAPASSFFWLFLFSDLLSSIRLFSLTLSISAFNLSILSEVWLLNFLRLYNISHFSVLNHPVHGGHGGWSRKSWPSTLIEWSGQEMLTYMDSYCQGHGCGSHGHV